MTTRLRHRRLMAPPEPMLQPVSATELPLQSQSAVLDLLQKAPLRRPGGRLRRKQGHRTPWLDPGLHSVLAGVGNLTQVSTSSGLPSAILPRCKLVWTGTEAEDIGHLQRRQLRLTYNQWRAEGLKCVAFSLVPVDSKGFLRSTAARRL